MKSKALSTMFRFFRRNRPAPGTGFENAGYCSVCRAEAKFVAYGEWLRDQYVCTSCGSIPRQRALMLRMAQDFSDWSTLAIHESSPSAGGASALLTKLCASYSSSQFLPGVAPGTSQNGLRCENLEALTFADGSFDLFITQDVFEHVFNPGAAFREVMRVLKPGGAHVFTAPKHKGIRASYPRATLANGKITHLLEESYHGNPVGDGRSLVTWDYGDDFEALIGRWCGYPTTTYVTRDRSLGIDGEYLEVFVTRKIQ